MSNASWINRTSYDTRLPHPNSGRSAAPSSQKGEIVQAIVIKTFQDPSLLSKKEVYEIYNLMNAEDVVRFFDSNASNVIEEVKPNSDFFLKIPRNSILIRNSKDSKNTEFNNIAYPFFSSHLMLPIKVGEFVWCFKIGNMYYWMSRVHGTDSYEDVNYTHENRMKDPVKNIDYSPVEGFIPNFSNFQDSFNEILTFQFQNENDEFYNTSKPFDDLLNSSNQKNNIFESVPRITPRPGDLILQGSNNAAILLSTQRGYGKKSRPSKDKNNSLISSIEQAKSSGAIDIVVGRGRKKPKSNKEHDESSTEPREIVNSRGNTETNKNPLYYESENNKKNRSHGNDKFCGNVSMDVPEGDPDFVDDAARVYVSMKMDADDLLGLNDYCPAQIAKPGSSNAGISLPPSKESSTVLLRADDIRIVARKDDARSINGSIRIIKEGIRDDVGGNGSAVIMIQPDGTIVIDGPKILIGGALKEGAANGGGDQVSIGLDATEPLVLGNTLKILLEQFMDETMQALKNHQHTGGNGPVNPAGAPNEPTYDKALKPHIDKMEETRNKLNNFLSKLGKTQ